MIELIPNYIVDGSDDGLYVVKNEHGTRWIVNLVNHECDCQKWQLSGIVCIHVIAVLYPRRMSWTEYCSSFYHVRSYLLSYSGNIKPMRDMKEWPKPTDPNKIVRPPPFERGIGRPRKQRIREEYEEDIGRGKNKRRKMTCTRCKKQGQNSRTCKGPPASKTGRNNNTTAAESVDSVPVDSVPPNSGPVTSGSSSREPAPPPRSKKVNHQATTSRGKSSANQDATEVATSSKGKPSAKQTGKKSVSKRNELKSQPQTLVYYSPSEAYLKGTKAPKEPVQRFFQGPKHRHSMGDLLAKQHHKSTVDVLTAARETFGAPGATPPQTREPTPYPWPVQAPAQAPTLSTQPKKHLPPLAPPLRESSRSKAVRPPSQSQP
ncbi:hypothetical protein IFM89_033272 [Coptis chinensis]|uniref:SWIM-type domain-containing protein n=1 Tax=Coptis chinensis TaxID=261450 RepID=A0A835IG71_9MAGN|nr:hypothetical protein IFM89_033272 [Coptis chinensis]